MLLLLSFMLNTSFAEPTRVDKSYAKYYIGRDISICDTVSHVSSPDEPSKPYIIYFEKYNGKFRKSDYSFNGIIWSSSAYDIEISPKADLSGRDICISGVVSSYNGVPQIIITKSSQVSIVVEKQ